LREHDWLTFHFFDPCNNTDTPATEHAVFANADFNPNEYANAILAGEPYPPQHKPSSAKALEPLAKEDISIAISKLNFGIEDVSKQIKSVVSCSSFPSRCYVSLKTCCANFVCTTR
jgi:hypothetical protein